jgi:hypothetical protein
VPSRRVTDIDFQMPAQGKKENRNAAVKGDKTL